MEFDLDALQELPTEDVQAGIGCRVSCSVSCGGSCPATCWVSNNQ
ncbi:ALQxL family class IV lanthipeptide [Kitasatospora azatica]|nr:ALQxL family class IV lanthipeptide [Kitasatospora azatica]